MNFYLGDKIHRNVLLNCDHGMMIVNRFDCNENQIGHSQWLLDHGNCSTVEAWKCINSLTHIEDPVIFDIGANIGTFTTWISKSFIKGKIYCFEPQHTVFQQLAGNIAINNLYNVFTYNLALGSENTFIEYDEPDYFSNNDFGIFSLVRKRDMKITKNKIVVQVLTLDTFMSSYKVDKINLMKVDVEGMDLDVLLGAKDTIKKFRPKILIEHYDNETSIKKEITHFLSPFGYEFEIIGNNLLAH